MLELRRAPARPRQAVVVALVRAGRGLLREHVEVFLIRHVRLQPLRRLAAVAGRPAAAVDLAEDVLGDRHVVLDLDVLEHLVGEAELLGEEIHHLVVVLGLEDRLDDLLAPLDRAVGRRARAGGLVAGRDRQQIRAVLALRRQRRPGGRMRIADHEQFERLDALLRLRHAGHGVAAVTHDEHRLDVVLLLDVLLVVERRVEPAGRRDARRVHRVGFFAVRPGDLVEAVDEPVVVDLPDARPMPPRAFDQAVVERQRHDIEAEVGRALHVGVAAEDVGAGARTRRRCRWRAARCRTRARWRCRRCAGSRPCTRSGSRASRSRTSWRRARAARPARRRCARPLRACTSRPPCGCRPCRRRAAR